MIPKGQGCVTELAPRRPIEGRAAIVGDVRMVVRDDLTAHLLTTREPVPVEGAIRLSPCDHLLVGERDADSPARLAAHADTPAALVQDMTPALVFIEIAGTDVATRLGIAPFASETGGVTRLADLRVIVARRGPGLCLIVDRSYADYIWTWLTRVLAGHLRR